MHLLLVKAARVTALVVPAQFMARPIQQHQYTQQQPIYRAYLDQREENFLHVLIESEGGSLDLVGVAEDVVEDAELNLRDGGVNRGDPYTV